jgi:hypothetical protein
LAQIESSQQKTAYYLVANRHAMRGLMVRLNDYSARRAILMAVMKIPSHFGTAHLAKADMMIGRHSAPLVMNLPLWFGSGQPEQARLSSMIHSPTAALCHRIIGVAIDKISSRN